MPAMQNRLDIFSLGNIRLIFSNLVHIHKFHQKFLEELRVCIEQNQVAKIFLKKVRKLTNLF